MRVCTCACACVCAPTTIVAIARDYQLCPKAVGQNIMRALTYANERSGVGGDVDGQTLRRRSARIRGRPPVVIRAERIYI